MPKIMVLSVSGVEHSYKRLVSVDDEEEFLGTVRMAVIKEFLDTAPVLDTVLTKEGLVIEALSKMRVSLVDTGLEEYPSTEEEIEAAIRGEVLV